MPGTIAVKHFRLRNDDGSESTATWKAAQDTGATVNAAADANVRLRLAIQNSGVFSSQAYILKVSKNGGAAAQVGAASSNVRGVVSSNLTDGNNTTNQLTLDSPNTYATTGGVVNQTAATSGSLVLSTDTETEAEWSLVIRSADVADGDTLDFTMFRSDGAAIGNQFPGNVRITVSTSQTLSPAAFSFTWGLPSPVVAQDQTLSPDGFRFSWALNVPALSNAQTISPDAFSFVWGLNPPSIDNTPGNADLQVPSFKFKWNLNTPVLTASGSLKFRECRDNKGAAWTAEVSIDSAAGQSGGGYSGNQFGALYSQGNSVYWRSTPKPDDWTVNAAINTGISGIVQGCVLTDLGVLCGLVKTGASSILAITSNDFGLTWHSGPTLAISDPVAIVQDEGALIIVQQAGGGLKHWISKDCGASWL